MAFKIHSTDDNRVLGIEYHPASEITPKVGLALTVTNGELTIATGTTKPTYISLCEKDSACTAGEIIPVIRVDSDCVFETLFSASASSVKIGDKVTIAADGLRVTGTTTGGVAEVVHIKGTSSGSAVRVRF